MSFARRCRDCPGMTTIPMSSKPCGEVKAWERCSGRSASRTCRITTSRSIMSGSSRYGSCDRVSVGAAKIQSARETARLWHWRARATILDGDPGFELPAPLTLVSRRRYRVRSRREDTSRASCRSRWATTSRPSASSTGGQPGRARGDLSIAYERHRALNWLCGPGRTDGNVPLDT